MILRVRRATGPLLVCALAAPTTVACSLDLDYLSSGGDAGLGGDGASSTGPGGGADAGKGDAAQGTDALMTTSADVSGATLVENSGFESGLAPWIVWENAPMTTSTLHVHTGMYSAYVSARAHTYQGPVQDLTARVMAGAHYDGTAWVMVASPAAATDGGDGGQAVDGGRDGGDGGAGRGADAGADGGGSDAAGDGAATLEQPAYLTAKIGCAADGSVTYTFVQLGSATANNATWTLISGGLDVPPCKLASLSIYVEGPAAGVDLYVDDVNVW